MRRESWSIAWACALGAFIGALAAMEIATQLKYGSRLWPLGLLVGGIVSWVAVDFRHFWAGIARAGRKTGEEFRTGYQEITAGYQKIASWKPGVLYREAIRWWPGAALALWITAYALFALCHYGVTAAELTDNHGIGMLLFIGIALSGISMIGATLFGFMVLVFTPFVLLRTPEEKTEEQYGNSLIEMRELLRSLTLWFNPIGLMLVGLLLLLLGAWYLPSGASYVARKTLRWFQTARALTWLGMRSGANFLGYAFAYAHSQRRTICFVDSILGGAIGYSFGSPLVGALAGAVLGVINYELVSVRWLKLNPSLRV